MTLSRSCRRCEIHPLFCSHFPHETQSFAKTGSGQTQEKTFETNASWAVSQDWIDLLALHGVNSEAECDQALKCADWIEEEFVRPGAGRDTLVWAPISYRETTIISFTKTGSGRTEGNAEKNGVRFFFFFR
jgi:hypothetical protein